ATLCLYRTFIGEIDILEGGSAAGDRCLLQDGACLVVERRIIADAAAKPPTECPVALNVEDAARLVEYRGSVVRGGGITTLNIGGAGPGHCPGVRQRPAVQRDRAVTTDLHLCAGGDDGLAQARHRTPRPGEQGTTLNRQRARTAERAGAGLSKVGRIG